MPIAKTPALLALPIALGAVLALPAQERSTDGPHPADGKAPAELPLAQRPQKMAWPRDRERPVCKVGGREYTLEDLLRHIDERHYPGMLKLIETPTGRAYFDHPLMAEWVREFADAIALENEANLQGVDFESAKGALSDALKSAFESYLADYQKARAARGDQTELTQQRIDILLTDFQRDHGLETEVRGWLDALVPAVDPADTQAVRDYYEAHAPYFGGVVTVSEILIQDRDPRTLELLTGEAREAAFKKLADVRARLEPDGSNFEEVARLLSDERRTANDGGRLSGIQRFDSRLPAALCRTAWGLKDGEVSEPFESPYGIHIVKRIGYRQLYYVIFTDRILKEIAATMRKDGQEELLFGARKRQGVVLYY